MKVDGTTGRTDEQLTRERLDSLTAAQGADPGPSHRGPGTGAPERQTQTSHFCTNVPFCPEMVRRDSHRIHGDKATIQTDILLSVPLKILSGQI